MAHFPKGTPIFPTASEIYPNLQISLLYQGERPETGLSGGNEQLSHARAFLIRIPFMAGNIWATASLSFKVYVFQAKRNKTQAPLCSQEDKLQWKSAAHALPKLPSQTSK